ncbi:kinase-like protein, partial [Fistulina hepatica ATCC 64428]
MSPFLDMYEPLDVIGNGSFGIIRKVRRKSDGVIFARKELNFERMTERDRKQIVAEVNILKDLHHDHIVRYHDRCVDRDAGILYILMEYCGGGDLSMVIKQATKHNRPIPEETIWSYFLQILLALHYCHHPNGHGRTSSVSSTSVGQDVDGGRRPQILHRDLKPDNVFLDENNLVKLGDFGLSKALAQASFANTYVGTPYYMSPELMQEKAYDSKSDIWSLGCLIYELCALKPPFHEAKTHSELNILIRNGRIPPLPRCYSQALTSVIKSMLNLNPAMRPSVAQLLQNERLELAYKIREAEKLFSTVKAHKANLQVKEQELLARQAAVEQRERQYEAVVSQNGNEIAQLQQQVAQLQQQIIERQNYQYTQQDLEQAVHAAVEARNVELRKLIDSHQAEVARAMAHRESELMEAVQRREDELFRVWEAKEQTMTQQYEKFQEVEAQVGLVNERQEALRLKEEKLNELAKTWEIKMKTWVANNKGRNKNPLEEVQNLLEPLRLATQDVVSSPEDSTPNSVPFTPLPRVSKTILPPASAMKGIIMTATGEALATPVPGELANIFLGSPQVDLKFTSIFDRANFDDD